MRYQYSRRCCTINAVTFDEIVTIFRALEQCDVEYVLVGGIAVGLPGFERATTDIDLFVRPSDENIAKLRRALRLVYEDDSIEQITASDLAGEYPTIRYGPPAADFVIDLLGRLGTQFEFDDLEFESLQIDGATVRLATPRTLYRMKRNTVRPIDRIDAEVLKEAFHLKDE